MHQKQFDKAESIFRELDKRGNAKGTFALGVMYQFGYGMVPKDYAIAMILYRKAAKANIPEAIHNVGFLYQHGLGVDKDQTEAIIWYTKAANLGFARSQYDLAWMYHEGQGVKKDFSIAFNLLKQAAAAGISRAFYNIGTMYSNGEGVQKDYTLAYAYIVSSTILGEKVDQEEITWYRNRLSNQDKSKAESIIIELTKDFKK